MDALAWGAPILPGKLEQWKKFMSEIEGPRREAHAASRNEMGVHREVVCLMHTPDGDVVSLFHEADDMGRAFKVLATSESEYLQWFRRQIVEIHGLTADLLRGGPPVEAIMDFQN